MNLFRSRRGENIQTKSKLPLLALTYIYYSALQCVDVCCSVMQHVTVCCSVLQFVAVCCVAVCCSVVQYVAA